MLHIKLSPGSGTAAVGRLLQALTPSDKSGAYTMSAYVRVVSGKFRLGQEGSWAEFSNTTWQRVSTVVTTPSTTLGGAWGFGGQDGVYTEAYVALPKVEANDHGTAYLSRPGDSCTVIDGACGAGMYNMPEWYFDRVGGWCPTGQRLNGFQFVRCGALGTSAEGLLLRMRCCL
jgi:hypothetical protein